MSALPIKASRISLSDAKALLCDSSSSGAEEVTTTKEEFSIQVIIRMVMESPGKLTAAEYTERIMAEKHLFIKPKTFILANESFCIFIGATIIIIGESKEGKTTFIITELAKLNMNVIVIDGDGNDTFTIDKSGENTKWLQPSDPDGLVDYYLALVEKGVDFSDYIFVIDSLQNFTDGRDIDTNNGMKGVMLRLKKLTHTGATLVILHHVTATDDKKKPFKPKGNSEVLFSQADITYGFRRSDGLTAIKSRVNGISNDQKLGYGENQHQDQAAIQTMDALMEDN